VQDEEPKSAIELAMERLRRQDRSEGRADRPLSDDQRLLLAETRRFYEAKLAELEILQQSSLRKAKDAADLEATDSQYREERERLVRERDAKLDGIRNRD
jgi:hypothetical protein